MHKSIFKIVKKEIASYLDNPAFYVVVSVFFVLWFFMFFRSVFLVGEASLSSLFQIYPWIGLILISALTMGSIAKEKDDGTLEFLLTHPITELQLILAKIVSAAVFVFSSLLLTLPLAIIFSRYGAFDWGVYGSQMLAAMLFSLTIISLGVLLSSLFNSQIVSLLSTLAVGFLLIIMGTELVTIALPSGFSGALQNLSLLQHYDSIARGVLDFYDISYFVSLLVIFILLSLLQLYKRKYGDYKARYTILQTLVFVLVGVVFVLSTVKMWIPLRIDTTQGRVFTLSDKTKRILKEMSTPVTITLYASQQLPSQYTPILRDLKYVLADYKFAAGNKIILKTIDPSKSPELEQTAQQSGIQKIQFNVIGKEEVQLKSGYLGIVLSTEEKSEPIPFISVTNDIEYQLTSLIKALTSTEKKNVYFLSGHGEKTTVEYNYFGGELQREFGVNVFTLNEASPNIPSGVSTIVIAGPTQPFDDKTIEALKQAVNTGTNLVVFSEGYSVDNTLNQGVSNDNMATLLDSFGVTLNRDLAYDLASYSRINFRDGSRNLLAPYPYWIVSRVDENNPIGARYIRAATLFWASTIDLNNEKTAQAGYTAKTLLTTTSTADALTNVSNVYPADQYPQEKPGVKTLGVVLEPQDQVKGKVVVIGDSDFLADTFLQRNPENMALGSYLVAWASGSDTLADIQLKGNSFPLFKFTSQQEPNQIRVIAFGYSLAAPLLVGAARAYRRRVLRKQVPVF